MKKYIVLEVTIPEPDYTDDGDPMDMGWEYLDLQPKSLSFDDMLKQPEFRAELVRRGWIDKEMIDKLNAQGGDNLGPRMFVLHRYTHPYQYHQNTVNGQIMDEETVKTLHLANTHGMEHIFAIEVSYEALMKVSPSNAKLIEQIEANNKAKKKAEAAEKKKKEEAKQKRAAKKIEDAKKLLAKAGLKVET